MDDPSTVIPLARIYFSEEAWPRRGIDNERVAEFVDLYRDGGLEALPPLEVVGPDDNGDYLLADGSHRYQALLTLKAERARAVVIATVRGEDIVDTAFKRALSASSVTAKPLSLLEKRTAGVRLLGSYPDMSDRDIGRLVGLSHQTVGRLRKRSVDQAYRPEGAGETYLAMASAEEIARRLVTGTKKIWDARGLSDLFLGDQTAKRFAAALKQVHGPSATEWANRFAGWAAAAAKELQKET